MAREKIGARDVDESCHTSAPDRSIRTHPRAVVTERNTAGSMD